MSSNPFGRLAGSLPVAMIVFLALTSVEVPSIRSTAILPAELNFPHPLR